MIVRLEIDRPPHCSTDELAEFIHDSLSSWGGQKHPEDPLFHSFRHRIKSLTVAGRKFAPDDYDKDKQ